jgi:hypothetical protein
MPAMLILDKEIALAGMIERAERSAVRVPRVFRRSFGVSEPVAAVGAPASTTDAEFTRLSETKWLQPIDARVA